MLNAIRTVRRLKITRDTKFVCGGAAFSCSKLHVGLPMINAIFHAVFSRFALPVVLYVIITVIAVISTINRGALGAAICVLAASVLSYLGSAAFTGALLERKTKRYRTIDLIGMGAFATLPIAAAFVLAHWSDFEIGIFGYNIDGFYWVLLGMIVPIIVVRPKDILSGWTPPKGK
jgi:hypothetical protein